MPDLEIIKSEYEKLISADKNIRLLSFDKVVKLEQAKDELIEKYISKIKKIDNEYKLINDYNIIIDDIIDFSKEHFGTLNHIDCRMENHGPLIILAFNFGLIKLTNSDERIKCKINLFWDF